MTHKQSSFIGGQLLVAMPDMGDARFKRGVVYMMAHDDEGAMGFIINKPVDGLQLGMVLEGHKDAATHSAHHDMAVFFGGPVQTEQGFILHSSDCLVATSKPTPTDTLALTQTADIFGVREGRGPEYMRFILGYAGWGSGQLEQEIRDNAWLVVPYDAKLVFEKPIDKIYTDALHALGVSATTLVGRGGEA